VHSMYGWALFNKNVESVSFLKHVALKAELRTQDFYVFPNLKKQSRRVQVAARARKQEPAK
jgi:hypothetical protein